MEMALFSAEKTGLRRDFQAVQQAFPSSFGPAATMASGGFSKVFQPDRAERPGRVENLSALRAEVRRLERGKGRPFSSTVPLGIPLIDRHLAGGGLSAAALHEIEGARGEWDDGAATAFSLLLVKAFLKSRPGPVLWISGTRDLYGPGLAAFGLDPGRFLFVQARREEDRFWALEEGLADGALSAVVGEVERSSTKAGRRLQLAAGDGGVPAILLRRGLTPLRRTREASAAETRWCISAEAPKDAEAGKPAQGKVCDPGKHPPGASLWRVELLRCRGASPGSWLISDPGEEQCFREEQCPTAAMG